MQSPVLGMKFPSFHFSAFIGFLSVVHAILPIHSHPGPHNSNYTLQDAPTCDMQRSNMPEFPVTGQFNLYWTFCISTPKTSLDTQEVDSLIEQLINVFHRSLPPNLSLNLYRDANAKSGDARISLGIGPAPLGGGPLERHDQLWFITNRVAATVLGDLQGLVKSQQSPEIFASEVFVYEKQISPLQPGRGAVASGRLEKKPRAVTDEASIETA